MEDKNSPINMELYHAYLERNGVQMAKSVDNSDISRTQMHKVYVEQTKKQSEKRDKNSMEK